MSNHLNLHCLRMGTAHRDIHPADHHCDRIPPAKHAAMGHSHTSAFVESKRAQALSFFFSQTRPVDRDNARALANREIIKIHGYALPD